MKVSFRSCGASGIELRRTQDFDVRMGGTWVQAGVLASDATTVTLTPLTNGSTPAGALDMVRYLFSRAPCSHPATAEHADIAGPGNCSVYAKAEGLPAPPFLLNASGSYFL